MGESVEELRWQIEQLPRQPVGDTVPDKMVTDARARIAAQYHRLVPRRGRNKAAVAVGHSILVIVWHLLQHDCPFVDLGSAYFDERDRAATERRLVRDLEQLGYSVHLDRPAA
jgi:hypothetical protein